MSKRILLIASMLGALVGASLARGQSLPLVNMGYSGAGIGSDLLKVIDRAGLWRKHGIDVRTIRRSRGWTAL